MRHRKFTHCLRLCLITAFFLQIANIQSQLENLIDKNYYLNKSAKEAYKCYVRAYDSHSLKVCSFFHREHCSVWIRLKGRSFQDIFDVNNLDLIAVSKSFGFSVPPYVDLPISHKPKVGAVFIVLSRLLF